jgi:MFS family permease
VFATVVGSLLPEYAERSLKVPAEDISIMFVMPLSLGIIFGLFAVNKLFSKTLKRVPVRLGLLIVAGGFLGLSVTPIFSIVLLASFFAFLLGLGASLVLIPALTFSQLNIPTNLRGRAFGLYGAITAFLVIGLVVPLGGLAEIIGVPIILGGLGVLASGIFVASWKLESP